MPLRMIQRWPGAWCLRAARTCRKAGTSSTGFRRTLTSCSPDWPFSPRPGSQGVRERHFKEVRARIDADTPLRLPDQATLSREEWAFYYLRSDKHRNLRYPLPGRQAIPRGPSVDSLLVEAGYRGGVRPHARRTLSSLVAEFVAAQPAARAELAVYTADLAPFEMDLLKPERTFAEKLLLLHVNIVDGVEERGACASGTIMTSPSSSPGARTCARASRAANSEPCCARP